MSIELDPGHAIIIKKGGETADIKEILEPTERKLVLLNGYIFQGEVTRRSIRREKNWARYSFPQILKAIDNDIKNTVFSYIPNTAEISFLGMIKEAQNYLNKKKEEQILALGPI